MGHDALAMSDDDPKSPLQVMGWREWIDLPALGIRGIKAKADTGARSSALHAIDVALVEVDGESRVRFKVHPVQRDSKHVVRCEAPLVDERWVRSSSGKAMLRPVIRTRLRLGSRLWSTEITLVRRDLMGFRMLLGRRTLKRRFLVDSGRSFLLGPLKKGRQENAKRAGTGRTKDRIVG